MKETSRTNMLFLNETKLLTDVSEFVFEQENFPFVLTRAHQKHFSDQQGSGKVALPKTGLPKIGLPETGLPKPLFRKPVFGKTFFLRKSSFERYCIKIKL
jgi:hypothetical protein